MAEHLGDTLGDAGLAGEGARELAHGGHLRGGGRGLREPLTEDGGEHLVGVGRLDQRKVGVLGERDVGGVRLSEREFQDIAVVGFLGAGLRDDAEQTGLRDRALSRGEIGGGEAGETHAGGEDGVFEHEVGFARQQAAHGFGDGRRLALTEGQAFEPATDFGLIGGRELGEEFGVGLGLGELEGLMGGEHGGVRGLPFRGPADAVDHARDVGRTLQAGRAMRIPGAGVEDDERAVRGFHDVGQVRALAVDGEEFVLGGTIGGAFLLQLIAQDLLGVVHGHHQLQVRGIGGPRMTVRGDGVGVLPEGAAAGHHVAELAEDGHPLVGAREVGDDAQEVRTLIDAAELPLHEGVDAWAAEIKVGGPDQFAGRREIEAGGVVGAAERVPADVGAVGQHRPDAAVEAGMHEGAVLLLDGVSLATVRPIEAAVGMQTRAVAVRAVGGPLETADEQLALVRDAVAVGVGEFPDARGVGHVEASVEEVRALRVSQFVREDGATFEHAVLVAILQEEDAVGKDGLELLRAPIYASGVAHEQATLVIDASHRGIGNHRSGGGDDHLKTRWQLGLRGVQRDLLLGELEEARTVGVGRKLLAVAVSGGLGGAPLLLEGAEREELEATDEHLGGFDLQEDAALAGLHLEGLVHLHAVDEILEGVALGDDLETGPLARRRLDVVLAAETKRVLPVDVALLPVETAALHGLARIAGRPDLLLVAIQADLGADRRLEHGAVRELRREDEDVAHAAFDDLGLDAGHPAAAHGALRAEAVHEDAVVARGLGALAPGLFAPLELDDQMVVLEAVERRDAAVAVAADVEQAVGLELEDVLRVVDDVGLRVDVHLGLSFAEQVEHVDLLGDGLRDGFRRQDDLGDRLLVLRGQSDDGQQREHECGEGLGSHGVKGKTAEGHRCSDPPVTLQSFRIY